MASEYFRPSEMILEKEKEWLKEKKQLWWVTGYKLKEVVVAQVVKQWHSVWASWVQIMRQT